MAVDRIDTKTKPEFKIIQISDSHLTKTDKDRVFGFPANKNFSLVMEKLYHEEDVDLIFATGDISNDYSKESYQLFAEKISLIDKPVYWIPGNHDNTETMREVFAYFPHFKEGTHLSHANWHFLFLNTKFENNSYGKIQKSELNTLQKKIELIPTSGKIAIVMHHPAIKVNTPLVDAHGLREPDAFIELVKRYKNISLIICGHVHEDYCLPIANCKLITCPATCFQFKKNAIELAFEKRVGYKLYTFNKEGFTCSTKQWDF